MSSSIKVVIDTNVLVSALWSDSGNPSAIIKLMPKSIVPCYNDAILQEYSEVLARPKFNFSAHKKDALFSKINEYGEVVTPDESDIPMPDETDRIFYDTARVSGAILITGNLKHYPPELFIMTPADFLSKMENAELTDDIELKLDEADCAAALSNIRYSHEEVFSRLKEGFNGE